MTQSSHTATIIRAVIELAQDLGISSTAEGIETEDQIAALIGMGCDAGQGYLFSRAVPASDVMATIAFLNGQRRLAA